MQRSSRKPHETCAMSLATISDDQSGRGRFGRSASHLREQRMQILESWPSVVFTDGWARGLTRGLSGEELSIIVHSDQVRGRFSLVQHHIPASHRSLMLSHDEADIVLNMASGEIDIRLDQEMRRLVTGSFVAIPRGTLFGWHNQSSSAALLVATYLSSSLEALLHAAQGCSDLGDLRHVAASFKIRIPEEQPG